MCCSVTPLRVLRKVPPCLERVAVVSEALEGLVGTAGAADAIARIRRSVPAACVGAGTLLTADQVKQAVDAGAQFGVSPGLSEAVSKAAHDLKLPLFPGIVTPSEIIRALDLGWKT